MWRAPAAAPTDAEWAGRAMIEVSDAIKCPTVAMQLTGAKKVQQALAAPGAAEDSCLANEAAAAAQVRHERAAQPQPKPQPQQGHLKDPILLPTNRAKP